MIKFLFSTIICLMLAFTASAQDVKIDKENCTITKNGKTFKLYGKVKFVEHWGDIKVQFVKSFGDIKVKFVKNWPDDCGEWEIVENWPDLKVEIVDSFPDIKVEVVENWPGIK
ncbi:MAG: hypothetical protein MJZ66_03275 [Bacteroidales bacterium]|nr:hypothetical protein [Bacteroidales bacterium]